ncbi:MAG: response regulator [Acidobacteriota bacterium]
MKKVGILIVDDHRVVLEGIKNALQEHAEFEIVGEASNGRQALALVRRKRPDVVVMDISMPDLNGIEATTHIKAFDPRIGVIIYSMYSDNEYVVDLLKAGISGFVLKEDPMSELVMAVRAATWGGTHFSPVVQRIVVDQGRSGRGGRTATKDPIDDLSLREREVLQLLAEGKVIKDIASILDLSPKTVETHKYNIMAKLDIHSIADLTRIAVKKKLITL